MEKADAMNCRRLLGVTQALILLELCETVEVAED